MFPTEGFQAGQQKWKTFLFFGSRGSTNQIWHKPSSASLVMIMAIGAGGGGGGGDSNSAGTTRGGGGGGGSGGWSRLVVPAVMLPDELYIIPGWSNGGAADTNGQGGADGSGYTYVLTKDVGHFLGINEILVYAEGGGAGVAGSGSGGTAGAAANVVTIANSPGSNAGIFQFLGGIAGAAGGGAAVGGNIQPAAAVNHLITGGAGGGGTNTSNVGLAGGNILTYSGAPQINGGTVAGEEGSHGRNLLEHTMQGITGHMYWASGGSGGAGGGTTAKGGDGGNGGPGCGGGGGGGGLIGGRGGDGRGCVIIACA